MIENVNPKKFLGQHFLIDENISKKIVNSVSLKEFDKIVEIGPGKGALTKYLFEFSDKLILIEYDTESVEFIKSLFKKHNPNIIKQDFLNIQILQKLFLNFIKVKYLKYSMKLMDLVKLMKLLIKS